MSDKADICMVFDERGNAYHAFDYTPADLEREADRLRGSVVVDPSPFVMPPAATWVNA